MNILVIDSEKFFMESFGRYLQRATQSEIQYATTFQNAIHLLENNCFDLIITDITLPDAEKEDWLMKIEQLNPGQKLIILSSYLLPKKLCLPENLNIIGYFEKPFDAKIIVNIINQLTN